MLQDLLDLMEHILSGRLVKAPLLKIHNPELCKGKSRCFELIRSKDQNGPLPFLHSSLQEQESCLCIHNTARAMRSHVLVRYAVEHIAFEES